MGMQLFLTRASLTCLLRNSKRPKIFIQIKIYYFLDIFINIINHNIEHKM